MNPESGFNISDKTSLSIEKNEQRLPIPSSRYEFFRTRRYGMLHFAKRPSAEKANDLLVIEALRKEFLIGYGLDHPGIVRYLHFEDNCIYEEFIEGKTIRQIIDDSCSGGIDKKTVISIGRQLFEAIGYIHSKGILHLDIKPENVMITAPGNRVKLIDFNCARSSLCDSTPGFTPEFMAPEQNSGIHAEAPTDIYLAGKTIGMLVEAAGIRDRRLKQFISRATDEDPARRYQSADDALKVLYFSRADKPLLWIITTVALAMCLILSIGLFLLNKPSAELHDSQTADSPRDTVIIQELPEINSQSVAPEQTMFNKEQKKETSVAPTALTTMGQPLKADNKQRIANEIEKHVTAYFNRNIFSTFKDTVNYQGGVSSLEFRRLIQAKMSNAYDEIMSYATRLKTQHPDQSTFIDTSVTQIFTGQSNRVSLMLEVR